MRVSAKVDYAVRACVELAQREHDGPVKGDVIREAQGIPLKFLENILAELRAEGIVMSRRGSDGGYWLARPAAEITVAQVVRAVEGPIAAVRGERPTAIEYPPTSAALRDVWVALRASLRLVLDRVTLAAVASSELPEIVTELLATPGAWEPREPLSH
ncbi:MAG: Rrf2 family transcriptional regulator [Acidimicrobiia bacterium]